jgi:hypothetical protein
MPRLEDDEKSTLNQPPTTVHAEVARCARSLGGPIGATLAVIEVAAGEGAAVRYLVDQLLARIPHAKPLRLGGRRRSH